MACEKFKNKECVGNFWCGICPLCEYENGYEFEPNAKEKFAMKAQMDFFKEYNKYIKLGEKEKAMSYYSCIQILQFILQGLR